MLIFARKDTNMITHMSLVIDHVCDVNVFIHSDIKHRHTANGAHVYVMVKTGPFSASLITLCYKGVVHVAKCMVILKSGQYAFNQHAMSIAGTLQKDLLAEGSVLTRHQTHQWGRCTLIEQGRIYLSSASKRELIEPHYSMRRRTFPKAGMRKNLLRHAYYD